MGSAPLAAQNDCRPVFDALDKVMSTSTHIYSTTKTGGKSVTSETIYVGESIFTLDKGKWNRSAVKTDQLMKQEKDNRLKSSYVCGPLKDETVDGEKVAVYSTKTSTREVKTEGKLSISKDSGLPVRNEIDVDAGTKGGKTHYSVRYEYKNVEAPNL
jgi:hypothetical protein